MIDVAGLTPVLSNDSGASSGRERAAGDSGNKGDSGDMIGEISGKTLGDRSTVSTSKSDLTRFGDSCSDDRGDTCDPGGLSGINRAMTGNTSECTTEGMPDDSYMVTPEFAESKSAKLWRGFDDLDPGGDGYF